MFEMIFIIYMFGCAVALSSCFCVILNDSKFHDLKTLLSASSIIVAWPFFLLLILTGVFDE